jgi:CDGSH-type Zn-finger protein
MDPITITVRKDGPYLITDVDAVRVVDHEGNVLERPAGKKNIALCRCGASTTKPFCDGTHSRIGFRAAEAAQREFDVANEEPGRK